VLVSSFYRSIARTKPLGKVLIALCLGDALSSAYAEPVIGQFELKTLESDAGSIELQSQNAWSWDYPDRRVAVDGAELLYDDNAVVRRRHALEVEIGFTRAIKMRAGVEFEQERLDDPPAIEHANGFGELELAEVGVELVGVVAPRRGDGTGFGVVVELEHPVENREHDTLFLGAIFEFQSGRWFVAAVPMVARAFGGSADDGERADHKWDFAYATQLAYTISNDWALALEAYGTVERLGDSGHPSESALRFGDSDQHRAGFVLYRTHRFGCAHCRRTAALGTSSDDDFDEAWTLTIGFGWLAGLNRYTPDHTFKLSIELDF